MSDQAKPKAAPFIDKTIANAKRLSDDARLLIEHGRYLSAISLSILAIEEFGKLLITIWGVKNKASKRAFPTHTEKQSATFALLSASEAVKLSREELIAIKEAGGGFHEIGPLSSQFAYARSGFFDKFRMALTYADEEPEMPLDEILNEIDAVMPTELLTWLDLAVETIDNKKAMILAATFYENNLGRL